MQAGELTWVKNVKKKKRKTSKKPGKKPNTFSKNKRKAGCVHGKGTRKVGQKRGEAKRGADGKELLGNVRIVMGSPGIQNEAKQ